MYISTMDVDDAVLKLLTDLHIPVGGRLAYATLVKEWPRMRLRHADLSESVNRLARMHYVDTQHSSDSHFLVLTSTGFDRGRKLAAGRLPSRIWRWRMQALQFMRFLLAGDSAPGRRRRLRDRVAPQV